MTTSRLTRTLAIALAATCSFALGTQLVAQTPTAAATPEILLSATTVNTKEPDTPVRIRIFRWSTDAERTPLIAAFSPRPAAARAGGAGAPAAGGRAGGGRGGAPAAAAPDGAAGAPAAGGRAGGGRGGTPAAAAPDGAADAQAAGGRAGGGRGGAPAAAAPDGAAGAPAAGGGAGGGRGGAPAGGAPGGGRGGAPAAPVDPIVRFTEELTKAPAVGIIWTTEAIGYSIKYAWHEARPDGSERIVLVADRRFGSMSLGSLALTAPGTPTPYEFTLFELQLDPQGAGEGKSSLTTQVVVNQDPQTLALADFAAAPVLLQVKR